MSKVNQIRSEIKCDDELNALGCSVATPVFVDILENDPSPVQPPATEAIRLPAVSIAAVTGSVEEGSTAVFGLFASMPVEEELTAHITLVGIDSFIGGNTSRTMDIAEGGGSAELSVPTINDDHVWKVDSIVSTVADWDGYEIDSDSGAVVVITDHVDREARRALLSGANQAVLSDLLGSRSARTLETATNRVTSAFSEGTGIKLELGGNTTVKDLIREGGDLINDGKMDSWQEVLGDSSFEFGQFPEYGASNLATVWGFGDFGDMFTGGEGARELDGGMLTDHLGFDTLIGEDMVAGLTTSHYRGELDNGIADDEALSYTTKTKGVHPYLGLEASDVSRLQAVAGYGVGENALDQEGYGTEMQDSSYASFGANGNWVLYSRDSMLFGDTSELSSEGESCMAGQFLSSDSDVIGNMRMDARHLRISTVGTHGHELENGIKVSPSVSMDLREDGKLCESAPGMEVGGGIGFTSSQRYEITTKDEVLFVGTDQVRECGMSGQLSYEAGSDSQGVQLSAALEWGRNMLVAGNALWGDRVLVEDFDSKVHMNGAQVNAEIGCGLTVWEDLGLLKPYPVENFLTTVKMEIQNV